MPNNYPFKMNICLVTDECSGRMRKIDFWQVRNNYGVKA